MHTHIQVAPMTEEEARENLIASLARSMLYLDDYLKLKDEYLVPHRNKDQEHIRMIHAANAGVLFALRDEAERTLPDMQFMELSISCDFPFHERMQRIFQDAGHPDPRDEEAMNRLASKAAQAWVEWMEEKDHLLEHLANPTRAAEA